MNKNTTKTRVLVGSLLSFFLWGSWAFFQNLDDSRAIYSAIGQGGMSLIMTSLISSCVEFLYLHLKQSVRFLAAYLPYLVSIPVSWLVHELIGTKYIASTLLLPILVGMAYTSFYVYLIDKSKTAKVL